MKHMFYSAVGVLPFFESFELGLEQIVKELETENSEKDGSDKDHLSANN